MKIWMELKSDTIFGNGMSIPGDADIAVLCDEHGFPYYKGGTFKGVFREELTRYLFWNGKEKSEIEKTLTSLLGEEGADITDAGKMVFSDMVIPEEVKKAVLAETGDDAETVTEAFTSVRMFTKVDSDGMTENGTLRMARCVNKGICFSSEIILPPMDKGLVVLVREAIESVKWIGTMRNRGFGRVCIRIEQEEEK